jgi:hypothetical protein
MRLASFAAIAAAGLALIIAAAAGAQQAAPYVWIAPPSEPVAAGQEFAVTVQVSGADGVYGISLTIGYDPQVVEVVNTSDAVVQTGSFFGGQPAFTLKNSSTNGLIEYALTLTQPAQPVSGEGTLGTITFRALSAGASGIAPLDARLLVPVFTEVNGQKIAQQIDETVAQVQGVALTVVEAGALPQAETLANPVIVEPQAAAPVQQQTAALPVLLAGGLLFLTGLALFAMSIGGYVGLRRTFDAGEQLVW